MNNSRIVQDMRLSLAQAKASQNSHTPAEVTRQVTLALTEEFGDISRMHNTVSVMSVSILRRKFGVNHA